MSTALPHSAVVAEHLHDYLSDIQTVLNGTIRQLPQSQHYRGIFKNSTAAYAVLLRLSQDQLPLLVAAAGIVRRLPLLIACKQLSLSYVEMRRFIELVVWYPYFREHPVEWAEFQQHPFSGFVPDDKDSPIRYCAHRKLSWYIAYAKERFAQEPSGIVGPAIDDLTNSHRELSGHVHAGAATQPNAQFQKPFDNLKPSDLQSFQATQRGILASGCLLVAATIPRRLARFSATQQAWFDWLIGADSAKSLRAGPFGIL